MISRISRETPSTLNVCVAEKPKKPARDGSSVAKIATTFVGLLAASQGLGLAAARPLNKTEGLALPTSQKLNSGIEKLAAQGTPPVLSNPASEMGAGQRKLLSNMQTWVINKSNSDIVATTSYNCFSYCDAHSEFVNRPIASNSQDHDQYCQQSQEETTIEDPSLGRRGQAAGVGLGCAPSIGLTLKYSTAQNVGTFTLEPDESVIVSNIQDAGGLNVYKAVYGDLSSTDGDPLGQIYDN